MTEHTKAEHTKPSAETREADRASADAPHGATETPTSEEERAAERNTVSPGVEEHYEEMTEKGAKQKGEGRIE
jgi:hypothetical protein